MKYSPTGGNYKQKGEPTFLNSPKHAPVINHKMKRCKSESIEILLQLTNIHTIKRFK